jgi:tetratricopeptide (TPR) repeat protein
MFFLIGCHPRSYLLEPAIHYTPQQKQFSSLPSAFSPLSQEEEILDWGKELKIGISFGRELDLYRAITAFKRVLILIPDNFLERRLQTEFYIVQAYYLGDKYSDSIDYFEQSSLSSVSSSFPAFRELVILLYDSYKKTCQEEKREHLLRLIEKGDPDTALDLKLYSMISTGDLLKYNECEFSEREGLQSFISSYCCSAKSVKKAQVLNAIFPGSGYYYVGQPKTAVTSFFINLFTAAAAYYFFEKGNWGAGCIATSLEMGWYFGGINGAGLAAKEFNQSLYQNLGKEFMICRKLLPVLMLEISF